MPAGTPAHEFRVVRRVEFADTDMAGIAHFSAFFRYMEATEHAFYRELGFPLHGDAFERSFGIPRVHASCDYTAPIRFEDEVEIRLLVERKGRTSLRYVFVFTRRDTGEEVARGRLAVVHVERSGDRMSPAPLPPPLADGIEEASVIPPGVPREPRRPTPRSPHPDSPPDPRSAT